MHIREVLPSELDSVGALRVGAYAAQDLFASAGAYAPVLRSLGAGGGATILVAVEGGELLGTVMLQPWGPDSEIARAAEEIEMRALAVSPAAQGRGVGRALVDAAVSRARHGGHGRVVLSTQPAMRAAQRLYRTAGFERLPDRDWSPLPGVVLLAFGLRLDDR
ncbi:GNAT family N-acetyltransferase [Pseudonocardia pini]|uniref:GNAT family N-acetyltransferase n=1 Tax=Pseudonocardia pini TaxID=2758030 RepID=UPI0015F01C5D|nr:GNAT family N-acetyltransferase [Pseudonocardia pini]